MTAIEFNYQLHHNESKLYGFALTLVQAKEEASDLVQETFLKALTYREKFTHQTNFTAWLFTIMKNTFINQYRRKKISGNVVQRLDDQYQMPVDQNFKAASPFSHIAQSEITSAIESLDDELLEPFSLHYNGFKYREIADQMNLPIGTVKSRIFQARKKLMEMLADYR